jgi:L-asparaginase II
VARSGAVESTHVIDVAVVDRAGVLVGAAGEPDTAAAFRSSAKPLQCRAALDAGWQPRDTRDIAIACASHNGEPEHVARARSILADSGLGEEALRTPSDVPAYPTAHGVSEPKRIYHNCSGKHAGMLAACAAASFPLETYRDADHPLQRSIEKIMVGALRLDPRMLIDGCGVPTYVAPLQALARAFCAIDDGGPEQEAMRAHPFLVGGTMRLDTDLMEVAPHVLIKSGAEGLACISANGYAIALKARDGDLRGRTRGTAVIEVLRALEILDAEACANLGHHAHPRFWAEAPPSAPSLLPGRSSLASWRFTSASCQLAPRRASC